MTIIASALNSTKNDLKNTWMLIGTLIKRKNKGQNSHVRIVRSNEEFISQSDIAEQFNQYFVNVGPNLAKTIQNINKDPRKFVKHTPLHSFFMSPVTEEWVANFFSRLHDKKSSLDIQNKLFRLASKALSKPLTFIFNESISTGILPDVFKVSKVINSSFQKWSYD